MKDEVRMKSAFIFVIFYVADVKRNKMKMQSEYKWSVLLFA